MTAFQVPMDVSGIPNGLQVIHIPPHATNIDHQDCELGFVTSVNVETGMVFCRYFRRDSDELRTTVNSERVSRCYLRLIKHRDQAIIDRLLNEIDAERMADVLSK